jgi:signal transduction protein with GAF and PtsI domain
MAMGYPVLSMNSPNLLLVKKALTSFPMSDAEQLLTDVLALDSAQAVKQATDQALAEAGLSQLIRVRR